jgi:hypothetical protein
MFASGFAINIVFSLTSTLFDGEHPGLFDGFDGWESSVLICNSLIGIATTAVYKVFLYSLSTATPYSNILLSRPQRSSSLSHPIYSLVWNCAPCLSLELYLSSYRQFSTRIVSVPRKITPQTYQRGFPLTIWKLFRRVFRLVIVWV